MANSKYARHRDANGRWCNGTNCSNHRKNPPLSPFDRLERKIARGERKRHPGYSPARIRYIAKSAAGKVAREKAAKR